MGEKRKFALYMGKRYYFGGGEGGGSTKISIIWIIYTPVFISRKIKSLKLT